jgi:hypothetical protein
VRVVYPAGKTAMLRGQLDMMADTIRAQLVSSPYEPTDEVIADVTGLIGSSVIITGIDVVNGQATADDITFPAVGGSTHVTGVVLYKDGGTLISFSDQRADTVPIDITPNGGDITMTYAYLVRI